MRRRDPVRSAGTGLDGLLGFFGTLSRDAVALHLALSFPLTEDRHDLVQCRGTIGHHPQHDEQILAGAMARMEVHERDTDHGDVEAQQHTLAAVADEVVKMGVTLQPAEKELLLPTIMPPKKSACIGPPRAVTPPPAEDR